MKGFKNTYNDELVFNDWTSLSQPILNSSWNYSRE